MNTEETKQKLISLLKRDNRNPICRKALTQATTASEVAQVVVEHLDDLYKAYGEGVLELIRCSLSPEVWAAQGVLINPVEIPEFDTEKLIVVADGKVKTWQSVHAHDRTYCVEYYGKVDLTVQAGHAVVKGTTRTVFVQDQGSADVYGSTRVYASGSGVVCLYDQTCGEICNEMTAHVSDRSFVESVGGSTKIIAHDEGQFIVSKGVAEVHALDQARGMVYHDPNAKGISKAYVDKDAVLYLENAAAVGRVRGNGLPASKGLILDGASIKTPASVFVRMLVPYAKELAAAPRPCIPEPLDLDRLKEDLLPLLPGSAADWQTLFELADDEYRLCNQIVDAIPHMVSKGLDSDFLRSHFTEGALVANGIHLERQTKVPLTPVDCPAHYFFGRQLVNASNWGTPVFAFERSLVVADGCRESIQVDQQAQAIVRGVTKVHAEDHSRVVAFGDVEVVAHDRSKTVLEGRSQGVFFNDTLVYAYDRALATGYDRARLVLHDHSKANAHDRTHTLAKGANRVFAWDQSEVACGQGGDQPKADIKLLSDQAKQVVLQTPDQIQAYENGLQRVAVEQEYKTVGIKKR